MKFDSYSDDYGFWEIIYKDSTGFDPLNQIFTLGVKLYGNDGKTYGAWTKVSYELIIEKDGWPEAAEKIISSLKQAILNNPDANKLIDGVPPVSTPVSLQSIINHEFQAFQLEIWNSWKDYDWGTVGSATWAKAIPDIDKFDYLLED